MAVGKENSFHHPKIQAQLHELINKHKAGSPTAPNKYWIHLKPKEIAALFLESYEVKLSHQFIKRELNALGHRYRKISKNLATGFYPNRDAQFQIIFNLGLVMSLQSPVLSIATKKKEHLGTLFRDGKSYSQAEKKAYDHDYFYLGTGLTVTVRINLKIYHTDIKTDKSEIDHKKIQFHHSITELNYRINA